MRIRDTLLLIAFLCVVLWLSQIDPTLCLFVCLFATPALLALQFVVQLKRRRKRIEFTQLFWAFLLAFALSSIAFVGVPFLVCLIVVGLIWLCTGLP